MYRQCTSVHASFLNVEATRKLNYFAVNAWERTLEGRTVYLLCDLCSSSFNSKLCCQVADKLALLQVAAYSGKLCEHTCLYRSFCIRRCNGVHHFVA